MGVEWLPRPLHPLLVHFPIALLIFAGGILLYTCFRPGRLWESFRLSFGMGMAGFLLAMITGSIDETWAVQTEEARSLVEDHELMAYVNLSLFLVLAGWVYLRESDLQGREHIAFTIAFWLVLATMAYEAHLGGKMVYELGVGTETGLAKP
jgi:uncharacterized membrane protein